MFKSGILTVEWKRAEWASEGGVGWKGAELTDMGVSWWRLSRMNSACFIPQLARLVEVLVSRLSLYPSDPYSMFIHFLCICFSLSVSLALSVTGHTRTSWGGWRSRLPWQAGAVKNTKIRFQFLHRSSYISLLLYKELSSWLNTHQ